MPEEPRDSVGWEWGDNGRAILFLRRLRNGRAEQDYPVGGPTQQRLAEAETPEEVLALTRQIVGWSPVVGGPVAPTLKQAERLFVSSRGNSPLGAEEEEEEPEVVTRDKPPRKGANPVPLKPVWEMGADGKYHQIGSGCAKFQRYGGNRKTVLQDGDERCPICG